MPEYKFEIRERDRFYQITTNELTLAEAGYKAFIKALEKRFNKPVSSIEDQSFVHWVRSLDGITFTRLKELLKRDKIEINNVKYYLGEKVTINNPRDVINGDYGGFVNKELNDDLIYLNRNYGYVTNNDDEDVCVKINQHIYWINEKFIKPYIKNLLDDELFEV
jgi:hypothetical protein